MDKWISAIHNAALAARAIPVALRYAITVALVTLTVGVQLAWGSGTVDCHPFLTFIPVVFVCGTLFDRGNGFLATVLSAAACRYYFLDPPHSLSVVQPGDQGAFVLFIVIGFGISSVVEALHTGLVALATEREGSKTAVRDRDLLLNELAHRTRNDFANVVTLLNLQSRSANAEAREALTSAAERVQTIARVHRRLELRNDRVVVDTKSYIGELCADLRLSRLAMRPIAITCDVESHSISLEKAVPLGLIINESVTNAAKHAFPDGRQGNITVNFRREVNVYKLVVADDGVGNGDVSNGGIGNKLMGMLAAQLNSKFTFERMSPGMAVVVLIPITSVK
ncbi:sensor histidine kinase [Hyphomicrobium sp.]|jgi:two-component sensor histidine kinase|uniref:sensor histidine kinase n=1 Tax=Hyphomicrobium sp. TaxID=82 RepID=UPI003569E968